MFEPEDAIVGTGIVVRGEKRGEGGTVLCWKLSVGAAGEPRRASDVTVHGFSGRLLGSGIV